MPGVIRNFKVDVTSQSKAALSRAIAEATNREIAQRLRRAGEASFDRCNELSNRFEPRYDDRRRNAGRPELANSFEIRYSNLEQVRGGQLTFRILSNAPSFWYLEYGTPPHAIPPKPGKRLAWPGVLLPIDFVVQHPGSRKYEKQWRQAVALQVRERFPGVNLGQFFR